MATKPKPSSAQTLNQNSKYDDQDFDIDIDQTYSDWITPIDSIRSFTSIRNSTEIIKKLTSQSDITGISTLINMENSVQESRCHAFFRMVGFPVSNSDGSQIYNPGFDIIRTKDRKITTAVKLSIAKDPVKTDGNEFDALSDAREEQSQSNLKTFSVPTSINAGVLALSSGGTQKLRSFIAPLDKDTTPLGVKKDDQSYDVDIISRVGKKNKSVPLTDYQDRDGNKPNISLKKRTHIIKPFIVDARIDLTVAPQSRLMAVPFIPNNDPSYLKVSGVESISPTVLEKIITERLGPVANNTAAAGTNAQAIEEYIKTIPAVKDATLLSTVTSGDIYKQADSSKFINSVNTIRTMMTKLVGAENIIRTAQENYYWVPAPATSGPEGGSEVQDVFLPTFIDTKLQTAGDQEVIISGIRLALGGSLNTEAKTIRTIVPTTDFGSSTSTGLGSNDEQNAETLLQTRNRILRVANDALRTVEIIMGEFSGLGLCDIVAIISALNIMKIESLLGFLDEDAYARMQKTLKVTNPTKASFVTALTDFTNIVKDYYNLMDKIYKDIKERQGIV